MVEGHCSNGFRDQGRTSGGRLCGRHRVVRRRTGPALPARRVKPRRTAKPGGRDLKRTLQGFSVFAAVTLLAASSLGLALAQVNCEAFAPGPQRTDCYIGLSRINRQKSEISAGVARQQADAAIYRQVTGKRPNKKRRHATPAW